MKKYNITLVLILVVCVFARATEPEHLYRLKTTAIYGNILKHTRHLQNIVQGPALGLQINYEMFTNHHKRNWHGFYQFPTLGVGAVWLNLGNNAILGNLLAVYPYLKFSLLNHSHFQLSLQTGAGLSYLTKTFQNAQYTDANGHVVLNRSNAAIGSPINAWFAAGSVLDVPLRNGFGLVFGAHWNHASNGSIIQPNSGLNMINFSAGIHYFPNFASYYPPVERSFPDLLRKMGVELIVSGGVKELHFRDNTMFPIGSLTLQWHRQLTNRLRMGLALDAFYNESYAAVNSSPDRSKNTSTFKFTYLTDDLMKNRFRMGVSLQPEFVFGRFIAGFHVGMYLINPIKNLEPYNLAKNQTLNKPLIYRYNIEEEQGWLYTRIVAKYSITNHLFINIGLKTHLHKAEFIEWGLGLRL